MVISHELKYVYIAIPRTASKSMSTWLVENFKGESIGRHHEWRVPTELREYLVFTIVRNPYERVVSMDYHITWGTIPPDGKL